jgi:hypothetical protein
MELKIKKQYNFRKITPIILVCVCLLVACGQTPQTTQPPKPTATKLLLLSPTPSLTLTQTMPVPSATNTPTLVVVEFVLSFEAGDFVGETITIKIEKAYCSYRPDVNGAPTFCNDQPYPNQTFTLISWGRNWTDLDGKCIFVEGVIEAYKGKFEIVADSRDQVVICE